MSKYFSVGDKVTLTESMMRSCADICKYRSGIVIRVGAWNIYDVQWNGIDHPIGMRGDELQNSRNTIKEK